MLPVLSADESAVPPGLRRLRRLVSPYGLVSDVVRIPRTAGDADFPLYVARLGDPGRVSAAEQPWDHRPEHGNLDGAAADVDPARAAHLAVAEALERYSACLLDADRVVWASAAELGDEATDLESWPRCSATERADPHCGLVLPDPEVPIRWIRGYSLTGRRPVYVPVVAAVLKHPPLCEAEAFVHAVSTGCAAHTDPVAAVVNGILEVVERDAVAVAWLQRLRLPQLTAEDGGPDPAAVGGGLRHVRTLMFDATTDLGIPVVYGLQLADHDPVLAQLVTAACLLDPVAAVTKVQREAASLRVSLRTLAARREPPRSWSHIANVVDGALVLGRPDQRAHFDFLLEGHRPRRRPSELPRGPDAGDPRALPWLVERLAARGCDVIAVDLSTDEARDVGAVVVRVLVPQLMPVSFVHAARYLGHPRLYRAPAAMGHPVHPETGLNPAPQPFA